MSDLMIRNLPDDLHRKLKEQAARHHRSMNREVIALLEEALMAERRVREVPPPYQGEFPLSKAFIDEAKENGRA